MYLVSRSSDDQYGNVIAILRADEGEALPFFAVEAAKKEKRLWEQEGVKSRFMVDQQILTVKQLETWARNEYKHLPKCGFCAALLNGEVHTNAIAENTLYCSVACADRDYHFQVDRLKNEEDCDL